MNNKLELPIGAKAEVFGKNVECVQFENIPCRGCAFEKVHYDSECRKIACTPDERTDNQFVILKEVESHE